MGNWEVACPRSVVVSLVSNLVRSSIRRIGEGAERRVRVRAMDRGRFVEIHVEDTGPAIPAEWREQVFDLYVRAPGALHPGIGIGLAGVKRLVEAHGGAVGVEPTGEHRSRFWLRLPRPTTGAETLSTPAEPSLPNPEPA